MGSLVHTTDHPRYRWLNDRVCAVEDEVRPRTDASGSEVVFEVFEMVWKACHERATVPRWGSERAVETSPREPDR